VIVNSQFVVVVVLQWPVAIRGRVLGTAEPKKRLSLTLAMSIAASSQCCLLARTPIADTTARSPPPSVSQSRSRVKKNIVNIACPRCFVATFLYRRSRLRAAANSKRCVQRRFPLGPKTKGKNTGIPKRSTRSTSQTHSRVCSQGQSSKGFATMSGLRAAVPPGSMYDLVRTMDETRQENSTF